MSDKLKLGLWHRTRSVQVRRGTPLDNFYQMTTEANVADIPTRPDKLTLADLGPGSDWEQGRPWMRKELSHLTIQSEEKEDFNKSFVFKHNTLDKANQGFTTMKDYDNTPTSKTTQWAQFSEYIVFPTKFKLHKVVRILAICVKFVKAFIGKWRRNKVHTPTPEPPTFFNCFLSGKCNLKSSSQSAQTELHARPLSVQYQAHGSYCS